MIKAVPLPSDAVFCPRCRAVGDFSHCTFCGGFGTFDVGKLLATIAEQQARLDAIAYIIECAAGSEMPAAAACSRAYVLATGKPKRDAKSLLKRFGKETKRNG